MTKVPTAPRAWVARAVSTAEITVPAVLVVLAFAARFALPGGVMRAVFVVPAILWVPGRCFISRLPIPRSMDTWLVPLAVLFSIAALIATSLVVYAMLGHVDLSTLPLWTALGSLLVCRPRAESAPGRSAFRETHLVRFAALFCVGTLVAAGIVAGVFRVLPAQQPTGYLAFSFAGSYATLSGVMPAQAGSILDVPVAVNAAQESLSGLTVAVTLDGKPDPGMQAVAVRLADPELGAATIELTVPVGCLSRFSFSLQRHNVQLRLLDLYTTTDHLAACGGH